MKDQKSLGRGLEEISSQFLSPESGAPQLEQLIKRLERLENKLGIELPAERVSEKAKPPTQAPQFQQAKEVLTNLHTQIGRNYIASGIIGFNGIYLVFDSAGQDLDQQATAAYLAESIDNSRQMIDEMSLGAMQSLMITTQHCHIFLRCLPEEKNHFLCLLTKREANIGMANLILDRLSPHLRFS